jgi:hypothetical protein
MTNRLPPPPSLRRSRTTWPPIVDEREAGRVEAGRLGPPGGAGRLVALGGDHPRF